MLRTFAFAAAAFIAIAPQALAQQARAAVSQCQAIAQTLPGVTFASFRPEAPILAAGTAKDEVAITFIGHSTFLIEGPDGVSVATDYNGWLPISPAPTVATMNKAHSSHYTLTPDPAIRHVLHGWGDEPGSKAEHHVVIGDTYIRNVTTDMRIFPGWGGDAGAGGMEADQNSIFIYEMAGLCIGHLGHLHHELTDTHYAEIGRLDVLMVPVDGGLTMGADSMSRVVKRLRSSLILPMHRTGSPRDRFIEMFDGQFDVAFAPSERITVSMRSLPKKPLIYVLKGM
ncbi:MBL fold metallo-hydrolase [Rhizobiaceae bacterium BDR2-2]|uniref:MBL fold metallo-hydrolase n=1 Tax=Ectorhizobium quercum TaxID=2965071 RepID=A0AAE3N0X1_9HYPH|nr:MBL fold metallo-hydrolase [Ectorhizobium quercum]MCX8996782.1 MBL fold metallo-hydrolase [Ectorhizobium quercum]